METYFEKVETPKTFKYSYFADNKSGTQKTEELGTHNLFTDNASICT